MPGEFSSKRSFLFDLDGTLVDSSGAHARAYVKTLNVNHPNLARHFDYARFAGEPTGQVFAALGLQGPELAGLTQRKQRYYRASLDAGEVKLLPGVDELLTRLAEANRRLLIVTGASRVSAEQIIHATGIAKYFAGMITAEDTSSGKPSPGPYLKALADYSLIPDDCLAIEDGESGVRSARAAGLEVVLIHSDLEIEGVIRTCDCVALAELVFG